MTIQTAGRPRHNFSASLAMQGRVLHALMVREGLKRFGHENLGFFWVFGEPMLLTVGVMAMWAMVNNTHGHNIGVVPFALTSYSMLTQWRHITNHSVRSMRDNVGLLFHRNVHFIDVLIAKAALDCLAGAAAFTVTYIPLLAFGLAEPIDDPLLMFGGWMLMTWLAFSFGSILAGLSELSDPVEQFVPPIMYITLPLTGAFYMVEWLPESMQRIVVWSPLVCVFEMFRGGFFGPTMSTNWYFIYPLVWCVAMTAIGLPLVRLAQKHVRME